MKPGNDNGMINLQNENCQSQKVALEKVVEYAELVKKVKNRAVDANGVVLSYDKKEKKCIVVKNSKGTFMKECPFNNEINLWNYWQGHGHMNPQIMVFGQDWGSLWNENGAYMDNIENRIKASEKSNDGNCHYFDGVLENGKKISPTDVNMAKIIDSALGIKNILEKDCPELYFTNVCLGYRNFGSTGNFIKKWITELEQEINPSLIRLLSPKVIVCLGYDAYESLLLSLGEKDIRGFKPPKTTIDNKGEKLKPFNVFIEKNNKQPFILTNFNNIPVFVFAHCGPNGTLNRNGGKSASLDIQIRDWANLKRYL